MCVCACLWNETVIIISYGDAKFNLCEFKFIQLFCSPKFTFYTNLTQSYEEIGYFANGKVGRQERHLIMHLEKENKEAPLIVDNGRTRCYE